MTPKNHLLWFPFEVHFQHPGSFPTEHRPDFGFVLESRLHVFVAGESTLRPGPSFWDWHSSWQPLGQSCRLARFRMFRSPAQLFALPWWACCPSRSLWAIRLAVTGSVAPSYVP